MGDEIFRALNICVEHNRQTKLRHLNLALHPGEVLGIFGLYDSGKKTLLDAITGKVPITNGLFFFNGVAYQQGQVDIAGAKILRISNSSSLIQGLSLWENLIVLRKHSHLHVFMNKRFIIKEVESCFKEFQLPFHPNQAVKTLTTLQQFFLEVLRSYFTGAKIILIGGLSLELSQDELLQLADFIRKLKDKGISIIVTSRMLTLLKVITDRIAFLAGGSIVHAVDNVQNLNNKRIESILLQIFPDKSSQDHFQVKKTEPLLQARLLDFPGVEPIELILHKGEVVAFIDPFKMVVESFERTIATCSWDNHLSVHGRLQKKIGWKERVVFANFKIDGKLFYTIPTLQNLCLPVLNRCTFLGFFKHRYSAFLAKDFTQWSHQEQILWKKGMDSPLAKRDMIWILLYRLRLANPEVIFCQDPWNDTDFLSVKLIYRELVDTAHVHHKSVCFLISSIENLDDFADRYLVVCRDGRVREVSYKNIRKTIFMNDQGEDERAN